MEAYLIWVQYVISGILTRGTFHQFFLELQPAHLSLFAMIAILLQDRILFPAWKHSQSLSGNVEFHSLPLVQAAAREIPSQTTGSLAHLS